MFRRNRIKLSVVFVCICLLFLKNASAADKKETFTKFLQVIGAEKNYQQMILIMSNQIQQLTAAQIQKDVEKIEKLSPEKQQEVMLLLQQAAEAIFEKYKNYMMQEIPFERLIDEVYFPIYDRYFFVEELDEIIRFYESPVGKKFSSLTPELIQETMAKFDSLYQMEVQNYISSAAQEEFAKIDPEIKRLLGEQQN